MLILIDLSITAGFRLDSPKVDLTSTRVEKALNRKVALLRICYWLGAILDARAAILLTLLRYRDVPAGILAQQSTHAFGMMAIRGAGDAYALMWGWTALLLWADRKPVERRGVLLLTAAPVILMIALNMTQQWIGGFAALSRISFWLFFVIGLAMLFVFSYFYASPLAQGQRTYDLGSCSHDPSRIWTSDSKQWP